MKKLLWAICAIIATAIWGACSDTKSYADLVAEEKIYINQWINNNPYNIDFGHIISKNEEWLDETTEAILEDSIHPSKFIELGQWYTFNETNFKRLYFCILDWGEDGVTDYNDEEQLKEAMRSSRKFRASQNAMVRYDSLFLLTDFDYDEEDLEDNVKGDNLDPNSYLIIYNWNASYYSTTYYSSYYSTGSSYECTSGGVAFPVRFLWEGGRAAIICPFSLCESTYQSYYYTFYYGNIQYKRPNYLPQ